MALFPESPSDLERIYFSQFPPFNLATRLMQLPMMTATERHSELVTYLKPERPRLCKPKMMRIGWLSPADQTRLGSHEFQVCLVSQSFGFGDRELAFVDFSRSQRGRGGH